MKNWKKIHASMQVVHDLCRRIQYWIDCWINQTWNSGIIDNRNGEIRIDRFPAGTIFSYKIVCLKNNVRIDSGSIWTIVYHFAKDGKIICRERLKNIFKSEGRLVKIGSPAEEIFFSHEYKAIK